MDRKDGKDRRKCYIEGQRFVRKMQKVTDSEVKGLR